MLSCLRDTGMPVAEMKRYAELIRAGEHTIPDRVALLEAHDRRIDEQVAALLARQARIRDKIKYYRGASATACPPSRGAGGVQPVPASSGSST